MRRELNEIEYFNWCVGQPYNMTVTVRVRGEFTTDQLREALAKAQRRHPLLQVRIERVPNGVPCFSSEGVGPIPVTVLERSEPDAAQQLAQRELQSTFELDGATPLMRVALLRPPQPTEPLDLVFTVQHVIADGHSMVFLLRDLLHFLEQPEAPVLVLDEPAKPDELFPPRVRRRFPRSTWRFKLVLWAARLWVKLLGLRAPPKGTPFHRSWELTEAETSRLRARCKQEHVSMQSALCTSFLPSFSAIQSPVSLRAFLARPVGEAFGLFVGSVAVRLRYRPARDFWTNARRFQRRFRRALRDPFWIFRLISRAAPPELVNELMLLLVKLGANRRPFGVTNLGQLDAQAVTGQRLKLESFTGGVTGLADASIVTAYTIDGRLHLHLLANEVTPTDTAVRDDAERAVQRLVAAGA